MADADCLAYSLSLLAGLDVLLVEDVGGLGHDPAPHPAEAGRRAECPRYPANLVLAGRRPASCKLRA
jgi:hypothetical protein